MHMIKVRDIPALFCVIRTCYSLHGGKNVIRLIMGLLAAVRFHIAVIRKKLTFFAWFYPEMCNRMMTDY